LFGASHVSKRISGQKGSRSMANTRISSIGGGHVSRPYSAKWVVDRAPINEFLQFF